jgi:NADP-dependent 3-hydroxy acid dehydrogenase YdfG
MAQFQDKVVIVTGAGTGIGRAIVADFVREGAKVALVGRRLDKLQEAAADLPQEQVLLLDCDVANREGVNASVQQVLEHFGTVDILVNNAGTNSNPRSVAEVNPDDWDMVVNVNLTGAFNLARAVLPTMREKHDGIIINVASTAGLMAGKLSGAAYSASKHGVVALTYNINEEEWENGIRASAVCPGEVNTPILDKRPTPVSDERKIQMLQAEDVSASVLFICGLPKRASVPLFVIKPMYQIFK